MLRYVSNVRLIVRKCATQAEVINAQLQKQVCSNISGELDDVTNRLFAVVYVNGRQWKVGQNDLISLEGNLPLSVGDRIKLDKVLLIGGSRFSVFGRPFLDKNSVCVEATVVEKTTKSPELHYVHRNHQHIKSVNWISCETTVLRINDISAKATLMEHAS